MKTSRRTYDTLAKSALHTYRLFDKSYEPKSVFSLFLIDLTDILEEGNASFKRDKFLAACGVPAPDLEALK